MAMNRTPITGPFKGIISDLPPTAVPNGWEDSVNFIGWKGRQRTRPGLNLGSSFGTPDGATTLNMTSFQDVANFLHTVVLTGKTAYMLTAGPVLNPLTNPTGYILTGVFSAAGTGYVIADQLAIAGGTGGVYTITDVDGSGAILDGYISKTGSGYTAGTKATTGGAGTGATILITVSSIISLGGANSTGLPYAVLKVNNRVYFCNGSIPLSYIDGEVDFKISGNVPGACRFLTVNQAHMIGAVWTEPAPNQPGGQFFPNRVRWSDSGNFDNWDESTLDSTAGVDDLINVPDSISGLSTIGVSSYLYRTNGISQMTATGSAVSPFSITNFSQSPVGEGCAYPYSLTSHNNVDRFIGNYDVWAFDGTNFTPLMDGKCNAKFFADLQGAAGGPVRGMITTVLDNGFQYLGYVVTIPGTNFAWILNIAEGSWNRMAWAPPNVGATGFYDLQCIEQVYLT